MKQQLVETLIKINKLRKEELVKDLQPALAEEQIKLEKIRVKNDYN